MFQPPPEIRINPPARRKRDPFPKPVDKDAVRILLVKDR